MANVDRCVCCGKIIPEGTMVCPNCLVTNGTEKGKPNESSRNTPM